MSNTTLAQISQMADDTWINGDVRCIVDVQPKEVSKKSGKDYWRINLTDPDDVSAPVVTTMVFADPSRYHNKICLISGKGNKKSSFKDKPQINLGKQGFFKIVGEGAAPAASQTAIGNHRAATATEARLITPAANQSRPAFSADGAKIGGCVARAESWMSKHAMPLNEDVVVDVAGVFLRATTRLENGEWALEASQQRQRPKPGPGGSVQTGNLDEDVPFN